jgi:uncharacterized membrane protein YccF (DUF307 family)
MPASNSYTVLRSNEPHWALRLVYFVLFGLWFSAIWAAIGWVLSVTVIGLPLGLWMLERLPQVTTLRAGAREVIVTPGGVYERAPTQHPFLLRALYFIVVGWWLSAVWIVAAWTLSASIIGLLFSFWMIDRVPAILTLRRS